MAIPKTLDEWVLGGPWRYRLDRNMGDMILVGLMKPFTIYHERGSHHTLTWRLEHEVSHLVACDDSTVGDPYYGNNEWFTTHSKLSTEVGVKELKVLVIHGRLRQHLGAKCSGHWADQAVAAVHNAMEFPPGMDNAAEQHKFLRQHAVTHREWRSITRIWKELQRKYKLCRALGYTGGE